MASAAPDSDRPLPPLIGRIDALLNSLDPGAGLPTVGPRERMTVQLLLMRLADGDALPNDARSLAQTIGPVICTTPRQQKLFAERCREWAHTVLPGPQSRSVLQSAGLISQSDNAGPAGPGRAARSTAGAGLPRVAILVALLVAGLGAFLWYGFSAGWFGGGGPAVLPVQQVPDQPQTGQTGFLTQAEFLQVLVSALPTLGFLFYLFVRRRRVAAVERGFVARDADSRRLHYSYGGEGLFRREGLRAKLVGLKQYRMAPTRRIDVSATISRALKTLGQVHTVVRREKPVLVETVVLVDRRSGGDHAAALGDAMVARLQQSDVPVQAYDFHENPLRCRRHFGRDAAGIQPFAAIAGRHLEDALILFTDGSGLVDRMTLRPGPWFQFAKGFAHVAVLTPVPMAHWGTTERTLMAAGLTVLPATPDGITAYSDIVAHIFDDTDHTPVRDLSVSKRFQRRFPRLLARRPERLLDEFWDGQASETDDIVAQLQSYLDPQAFELFCALAVFPKVHPELTLFLGLNLLDDRGLPLLNEYRLSHLSQLVWLRKSYIPNWLRMALIGKLAPGRQERVRALLVAFQQAARDRPLFGDDMEIDIVDPPSGLVERYQSWLRKQPDDSELRDVIYLRFMNRQDLGDLQAEAAGQLLNRLRDREIQVSGAGLVAAAACSVFVFTYYVKLTQLASSARNLISSLLEPIVAWGYANQSLFSWALLIALGFWFLRIVMKFLVEWFAERQTVQTVALVWTMFDALIADDSDRETGESRPYVFAALLKLVPAGLCSLAMLFAIGLGFLEWIVIPDLYDNGSHRFDFLTAIVASCAVVWIVQAEPGEDSQNRLGGLFENISLLRAGAGMFALVMLLVLVQASTTGGSVLGSFSRLFLLDTTASAVTLILLSGATLILLAPALSALDALAGGSKIPARDVFDRHIIRLSALFVYAIAGRVLDIVALNSPGGGIFENGFVLNIGFYLMVVAGMVRHKMIETGYAAGVLLILIGYWICGVVFPLTQPIGYNLIPLVAILVVPPAAFAIACANRHRTGFKAFASRVFLILGGLIGAYLAIALFAGMTNHLNLPEIIGFESPSKSAHSNEGVFLGIGTAGFWSVGVVSCLYFYRRDREAGEQIAFSLRNISPAWLFLPLVVLFSLRLSVFLPTGVTVGLSGVLPLLPLAAWLGWRYGRDAIAVILTGAVPLVLRSSSGEIGNLDLGIVSVTGIGTPGTISYYAIAVMIAWIFADARVPRALWNADRLQPLAMLAMIAVLDVGVGIPISGRAVGVSLHWSLLFYFLCLLIGFSRVRVGPFIWVTTMVILAGIVLYMARLDKIAYGLLSMSLALDSWTSLTNALGCLALGRGVRLVIRDEAQGIGASLARTLLSVSGLTVLCSLAAADVFWGIRYNPGYFIGASGLAAFDLFTKIFAAALFFVFGLLHGRKGAMNSVLVLLTVGLVIPLVLAATVADIGYIAPALMDGSARVAFGMPHDIIAAGVLCYVGWRVRRATHVLIALEDDPVEDKRPGFEKGAAIA